MRGHRDPPTRSIHPSTVCGAIARNKTLASVAVLALLLGGPPAFAAGGGGGGGGRSADAVVPVDPDIRDGVSTVATKDWPQVMEHIGSLVDHDPNNAARSAVHPSICHHVRPARANAAGSTSATNSSPATAPPRWASWLTRPRAWRDAYTLYAR